MRLRFKWRSKRIMPVEKQFVIVLDRDIKWSREAVLGSIPEQDMILRVKK